MPAHRASFEGKEAGAAKILAGAGPEHAGMGVLVSGRHIVTCAHVVNAAFGLDFTSEPQPLGPLRVTFPLVDGSGSIEARVIVWHPMGKDSRIADIAVLELLGPAPAEAGIAIFADVQGTPLDDDRLSVYGFAGGHPFGNHAETRFMGPAVGGLSQIDGGAPPGVFIQPGYSGAGVWDRNHQALIGMVVSKNTAPNERVAYMIPAHILKEAWGDLPLETRTLPPEFTPIWTAVAVAFFFLLLNHFLITRRGSPAPSLSFSGDHPELASFVGMHIYAFLAPVVFWLMRSHASAYALHDWSWRVPAFSFIRTRMKSRYRRPLSALTLVALVVLPLYAQGHFLKTFHQDGSVYIYAQDFGYKAPELQGCLPGTTLCKHPDAGPYSIVKPINGAEGGYWDNHYHYGHDRPGDNDSVTFFPILQPLMVVALTLLALFLCLSALVGTFRRARPD